jgi:hypothetical protein
MEVIGLNELVQAIKHLEDRYKEALAAAIYQEAAAVMAESLREVPVDVGRLRQSHYVAPPDDLDNPVAQAGYGARYGIYVHERTDMKHNAPTKDHFLSDPLARATGGYAARVANRVKENLQKGIDRHNAAGLYPKAPKT